MDQGVSVKFKGNKIKNTKNIEVQETVTRKTIQNPTFTMLKQNTKKRKKEWQKPPLGPKQRCPAEPERRPTI